MRTRTALAALTLTTLAAPLAFTAPALASHGGGGNAVRTSGGCDGQSTWKLKAKTDNGRIELEAEVDSNRSGQVWAWRIKHDGSVSSKGKSTTSGASGSFSVQRRMANLAGTDQFTFRAVRANGDVCRGTISL